MDWKFKNRKEIKHPKTFQINLGFIELSYQGRGKFYYYYRKNNLLHSGVFQLGSRYGLRITALVAALVTSGTLGIYAAATFSGAPGSSQSVKDEIGGFGSLDEQDSSPQFTKKQLQQIEKDEERKEELMAAESSTESNKSSNKKNDEIEKYYYEVKPGDTLSQLSERFNVSIGSIAGSSGIRRIDELHVGQELSIPSKDGFFYTVEKDDRLADILKKYGVSFEEFVNENPEVDTDILAKGTDIFLPGAKPKNLIRGWLVPVSSRYVTSNYGWRRQPRKAFHKGLDLRAPYVSVRASRRGRVKFAGRLGGYGNVVVITHYNGYKTLYGHLSRIYVRPGMVVRRGRVIGRSGNTGYSFGPHLHFEVSKNGNTINPRRILRGLRGKSG